MNGQGTGKISYSLTRLRYRRGSLYRRSTVWLILMGLPISRLLIIFAINGSVCWVLGSKYEGCPILCERSVIWLFLFFSKKERKNDLICHSPRWRGEFSSLHGSIPTSLFLLFFFLISTKSGWLSVYKNSKKTKLRLSHLKTEERPDRS